VLRASDAPGQDGSTTPSTWANDASPALDPKSREGGMRAVVELPAPITIYRGKAHERIDTNGGGR
jgi:hypothetical protein